MAREGDDAAELGIELLDTAQVNLGKAFRGEFAVLDPAGKLRYRSEGDVGIVGGQRAGVGVGANELITLGARRLAWENGIVAREGCECRFERDRVRTGAAFVE